jgi:hypothetical protein
MIRIKMIRITMVRITDKIPSSSIVLWLAIVMGGGCGRAKGPLPPPTFSVSGEVRTADGQTVPAGLVQFFAESNPSLNISAPIKNGSFTLNTSFGNQLLSGTMEGRYRVTVIPSFDAHGAPVVFKLPDVYEIKPQENHLVLTLPKSRSG